MPRSILVASLAALLSLFVWASAQAKEIYLPTLSTGTTPNLDWQNDYNLGNPSVEIRLKDGSYSFDNGRLEIYFQMHSNGHWADSARFLLHHAIHISSTAQMATATSRMACQSAKTHLASSTCEMLHALMPTRRRWVAKSSQRHKLSAKSMTPGQIAIPCIPVVVARRQSPE